MLKQRMTQYSVPVKNEPGELHRVAQILSKEGVRFTGLDCPSINNAGFIQFIAEGNLARRPLEIAGYQVLDNPCFQVEIPNRPEEFTRLTKSLADEDINVLSCYGTTNGAETWKVTLVVDKHERAQEVLSRLTEAVAA